jgi:hypothetical protein
MRILTLTRRHGPTSHEVGYGIRNRDPQMSLSPPLISVTNVPAAVFVCRFAMLLIISAAPYSPKRQTPKAVGLEGLEPPTSRV